MSLETSYDCQVVTADGHAHASQELLPEKRFLYFPHLAKAAGDSLY